MWDVLFVDDDSAFAKDLAGYIEDSMELRTGWTTEPAEAQRLATHDGVKVAVIDQKMPGVDGLQLGARLRQVDPRIRRIMLSGEATGAEITSAYDTGFDRSIHKNAALNRLPSAIRSSLVEYERKLLAESRQNAMLIYERRMGPFRRKFGSRVYLLSIDSIDDDHIPQNEWRSHRQLQAGEQIEEVSDFEWTKSESLEVGTDEQMSTRAGLLGGSDLAKISMAVRSEVRRRQQLRAETNVRRRASTTRRLSLPAEPEDPSKVHVRSRLHQFVAVYRRVSVSLLSVCGLCDRHQLVKAQLFFPVNRFATRHIDYLSDGTEKTTFTGFADAY